MYHDSDEFDEEDFNDFQRESDKVYELPVMKKAMEIATLVRTICDLIDEENEMLAYTKYEILGFARTIGAKIAGAEGGDLYDIRMECATFIRRAAHDLYISIHSLQMHGFEHTEYFLMVRKMIDEFRLLFIDWVAGFDKTNYIADRWGLFNPPGVSVPEDTDEYKDNWRPDFFGEEEEEE